MTWRLPAALPPLPDPPRAPTAVFPRPSQQEFRDVLAHLPAGVSVLTTDGAHGPAGLTASAVCSLSVEPPLLLACVDNRSRTLARLLDHGTFAVNVLRRDQTDVARAFADPGTGQDDRFAMVPHRRAEQGAIVFDDALAWLSCRVQDTFPGGDHTIVTGRVQALSHTHGEPLVWHQRGFRGLA
ncbi:oxidoreductase [Streptomyces lucensis JCM 4490]|uniref:Oxidoreductase n=1 Tax=Streptomyces lucensis JCM 4490 TaxID=1306176 RepID=A0A918JBV9_9ACTN|nr:flavin reductase family protein [Streptomyces lucensis]GGW72029.1 oxidoreductase [Streptomyces lucensis JCM 4490]